MFRKATLAAAALLIAVPAYAWNDRAHMTVAAVAWRNLTPATKAEVSRLLRMNPDYGRWVAIVRPSQRDEIAFIRATTWPDSIRGRYQDDGYDPVEPVASQNIGYVDRVVHRYWHYSDTAFSPDGTPVQPTPVVNAVSRIELFTRTLADPVASDSVKSYDLTWLLQLFGDIHQPLHAVERYTINFRHGDSSGNGVKVCDDGASYCGTNDGLHSFWDGAIGNSESASSVMRMAALLPVPDQAVAAIANPSAWASESFNLAREFAYASPIGTAAGPYRVTADYRRTAGSIADTRVALAGARLAALLNNTYR